MMPIQRQSDQFSVFDTGTRWERDRTSHDLPRGLAGLVNSMGPKISGGMLNTRTAGSDGDGDEDHDGDEGPGYPDWLKKNRGDRNEDGDFDRATRNARTAGEKIMPWTAGDWEGAEQFSGDYLEDAYRNHPDSWSHQPTEQDYADWEARHPHLANSRIAVNTDGMDPREHAYGRQTYDPLFGNFGHDGYDYEGVSRGEFEQYVRDHNPEEESRVAREEEDDHTGYNWGPEPVGAEGASPELHSPPPPSYDGVVPNIEHYDDYDHGLNDDDWKYKIGERQGSGRPPFDPAALGRLADAAHDGLALRTAAMLFPPCPNCGQVKGFEPYPWGRGMMWCNDRSCQHIVPTEDLAHQFNNLMLQHDLDVSSLPEVDHPTRGKHGRVAQLSYEDAMAYIDEVLGEGERPDPNDVDPDDIMNCSHCGHAHRVMSNAGGYKHRGYYLPCPLASEGCPCEQHMIDGGRTGAASAALNRRIAQLSYEDAMKYIDKTLRGGEPVTRDALRDFDRWHQSQHPSTFDGASGADVFEMYHDYLGPDEFNHTFGDGNHRDDLLDHLTQKFGTIDPVSVRPGPLVDLPLHEQDPEDFFGRRPYSGPYCEDCGQPIRYVSGPHCRHSALHTGGFINGKPDGVESASWNETEEGWEHSVTGARVGESAKYPGEWEIRLPTSSRRRPYTSVGHHEDPQVLMDNHDKSTGFAPKTAQQMGVPLGGGYQPGHRVGLPWRDSVIPGTVIGLSGPAVVVRWDDGQYSSEESRNIQLL